jgi:hypothetical protein
VVRVLPLLFHVLAMLPLLWLLLLLLLLLVLLAAAPRNPQPSAAILVARLRCTESLRPWLLGQARVRRWLP